MFKGCSSIISLPDISKWNTENLENMSCLFEGCSSLISLSDLSEWNMKNINDISEMFKGCLSLISLPDITKWNAEKIKNMSGLFEGCSSLKSLPDISKWNMKNIKDIREMFKGCSSLISLPDISKWNINNINDLSGLFQDCSSLKSLPDISKWNIRNLDYYRWMFKGCTSLKSFPDISKFINKNIFNLTLVGEYQLLPEIKLKENDIKILLCAGNTGVGCSSLSTISVGEEFNENSPAVACFSFREIKFFVNYKVIKAQLWNGPGQEKYRSILRLVLKDSDIILFVYDITWEDSFRELGTIIRMVKDSLGNDFIGVIVANKNDLFLEEHVDEIQGRTLAKNLNFKFYLTSAKSNQQTFRNYLEELIKDHILAVQPDLLNKTKKSKKIKK